MSNGKGRKPEGGVDWVKYYENNPFPSKLNSVSEFTRKEEEEE